MAEDSGIDDLLGPGYGRVVEARKALASACASATETATGVEDFTLLGTEELGAAVAALASSEYVDEDEGAARWVSRTFTAAPMDLIAAGEAGMAFGGAVMMVRAALHELDAALAAINPTAP